MQEQIHINLLNRYTIQGDRGEESGFLNGKGIGFQNLIVNIYSVGF